MQILSPRGHAQVPHACHAGDRHKMLDKVAVTTVLFGYSFDYENLDLSWKWY
jgi:hypothetical protein